MQKWQRELKLVDEETGLPNDQLNIGGYRSGKIWKPKSRLYGKPTDGGEAPPPECPAHQSFKDKQRELTDLNWDGSNWYGKIRIGSNWYGMSGTDKPSQRNSSMALK